MKEISLQVIKQLNDIRFQPKELSKKIRQQLQPHFKDYDFFLNNQRIQTFEGQQVLNDMVMYMSGIDSSPPLTPSYPLSQAANYIAKLKGEHGLTDNQKPKRIYDLIKKLGNVDGKIGQLICLKANQPDQIINYFLMDDGLATRKRRRMLLDPSYRYVGVGSAPHTLYGTITVILLAQKVTPLENMSNNIKYYESQVLKKSQIMKQQGDGY